MRRSAIHLVGIGLIAAAAVLPGVAARTQEVTGAAAPALQRSGIGETILLVVADVVAPAQAGARARVVNARFGSLAGFAVDSSDAYDLRAALVQLSPDVVRVKCPAVGLPFQKTISSETLALECPTNLARVDVLRPVSLRYVPRSGFSSFDFPSPCGSIGTLPCQKDRLLALFGSDLRMPSGRAVIASAFRTKVGAEEFIALARTFGITDLVTVQAYKLGGGDVGLGQEAHPDGSGPLEGPLADPERYQR